MQACKMDEGSRQWWESFRKVEKKTPQPSLPSRLYQATRPLESVFFPPSPASALAWAPYSYQMKSISSEKTA